MRQERRRKLCLDGQHSWSCKTRQQLSDSRFGDGSSRNLSVFGKTFLGNNDGDSQNGICKLSTGDATLVSLASLNSGGSAQSVSVQDTAVNVPDGTTISMTCATYDGVAQGTERARSRWMGLTDAEFQKLSSPETTGSRAQKFSPANPLNLPLRLSSYDPPHRKAREKQPNHVQEAKS